MDKLQPLSITAVSSNSYQVCFETSTGTVEFVFVIEETNLKNEILSTMTWDSEYSKLVGSDPAALALNQAIFKFHEARNFDVESK